MDFAKMQAKRKGIKDAEVYLFGLAHRVRVPFILQRLSFIGWVFALALAVFGAGAPATWPEYVFMAWPVATILFWFASLRILLTPREYMDYVVPEHTIKRFKIKAMREAGLL